VPRSAVKAEGLVTSQFLTQRRKDREEKNENLEINKSRETLAKVVTPVKTGVQECLDLVEVTGFRLEFIRRRRAGMMTIRS
jgi:BRCT domain type II-containing protein